MHVRISVLSALILLFFSAQSQNWQSLGASDFNEPSVNPFSNPTIACDAAGHPYVAYKDAYGAGVQVRMYNGTNWEPVTTPGISIAYSADLYILMDAADIPTLVYEDFSNSKVSVKKLIGGSWVKYGANDVSAGSASSMAAAIDASGKLYCAYADGTRSSKLALSADVNGTTFTDLGAFSVGSASAVSMAIEGYVMANEGSGNAYIAFADGGNANTLSVLRYNSGSWGFVGTQILSAGTVNYTSIAVDPAGVPYVAYTDAANGRKIVVKKFNGTSWDEVGTPYFSTGSVINVKLKIDASGNIYVGYSDGPDVIATVKRFDGLNWVDAGTNTSSGTNYNVRLTLDATGIPYVFYTESGFDGKGVVRKLTGGAWSTVGGQGAASQAVRTLKMAAGSSGAPYIIYADPNDNWNANVKVYNGTSWVPLGAGKLTTNGGYNTTIAMGPNDVPYVFFVDGYDNTVKKFEGGNWVNVGTPGFFSSEMEEVSMAVTSAGTPYLAGKSTASAKINVLKFDNGNWVTVGTPDFSVGAVSNIKLALDAAGNPYVIYSDAGAANKTMVKKLDGSNWVDVGAAGVTAGSVSYTGLAIDGNNTVYVSYYDTEVHVKKFDGSNWSDVGTLATGQSETMAFAIDANNVPYVAHSYSSAYQVIVKKFDGSNWVTVGTPPVSAGRVDGLGEEMDIAFGIGNVPILSYMYGGAYVKSLGPIVILPLQLTEFNGHIVNADARLSWKTESEENTRTFIIERSIDGRYYTTAGTVVAANKTGVHQYSFTDKSVNQLGVSTIYYRLKQVDADGKSTYSRILTLPIEVSASRVVCYPNPVTSETNITITLQKAEQVQARIINNMGQVVQTQQWQLLPGSTSLPVNMGQLPKGLYFLDISSASIKKQIGLVKQ
ncbi:hypothetical protein ABIE54_002656 [Chitinophagaceae bacterium OAS944]